MAELGELAEACLARRAPAPASVIRGQFATGLRCLDFGRHGRLRSNGVFAALGKNPFDLGVRAGNHVY